MAAAAILKIAFLAITHQPIVRFQLNFVWGSKMARRQGLHDNNCKFLKIQDSGRPPFWKSYNRHISVKYRPILMKFGTLQQMVNQIAVSWPKIEIFKIQDGFCGHNSSTIFRFRRKFVWRSRMASRQRPHEKKCKLLKSKMADGRHFENR